MRVKKYSQFIKESLDPKDFRNYFQSLIDDSITSKYISAYFYNNLGVDSVAGISITLKYKKEDDNSNIIKNIKHVAENIKLDYQNVMILYTILKDQDDSVYGEHKSFVVFISGDMRFKSEIESGHNPNNLIVI